MLMVQPRGERNSGSQPCDDSWSVPVLSDSLRLQSELLTRAPDAPLPQPGSSHCTAFALPRGSLKGGPSGKPGCPQTTSSLLTGHVLLEKPNYKSTAPDSQRNRTLATTMQPLTEPSQNATAPALTSAPAETVVPTEILGPELLDNFLSSKECLKQKLNYRSCNVVFCPPWMRCLDGRCECKLPYQCPKDGTARTCSKTKRNYFSYCQLKAVDCMRNTALFSHFAEDCTKEFRQTIKLDGDHIIAEVNLGSFLVCGDTWNMAAANVMCRELKNKDEGTETISTVLYKEVLESRKKLPDVCIHIHCTGLEGSIAECSFYDSEPVDEHDTIAMFTSCYRGPRVCRRSEFRCTNGKCIPVSHTCDAINDCGDNSDEMCCKECQKGFHCKSNVCIPDTSRADRIVDCLGGDDEVEHEGKLIIFALGFHSSHNPFIKSQFSVLFFFFYTPEIKIARDATEKLQCGVPNKQVKVPALRSRKKRVIGGMEAGRTQFPWQVAIQEGESIDCGGTYIGGCWVLTAAHCVRPKPEAFKVKLSVWNKRLIQNTTDIVPIENIIIHHDYNPKTYQNDIALIELKKLPFSSACFAENEAVIPACVPWSEHQFLPGDKCSISGWGRLTGGEKTEVLQWADIDIIGNCSALYGHRYYAGMECAGSLDGSVDSCQGDSGGPLVCKDQRGVAYIWGIVSWGEKCGIAGHPGVYTKVAYYFNWIVAHIGREAVSKYNL
ncbi:complement factor I [Arapaima gigas]